MAIPTNPGSGGPTLQSVQDGNTHDYQGVVAVGSLSYIASSDGLLAPTDVVVNASASGDNTLLAAQGAGTVIHVISGLIIAAGDVNVTFFSGAAGSALTGPLPLTANSGFALPYVPVGHFRAAANTALILTLSASVQVSGHLVCIVE